MVTENPVAAVTEYITMVHNMLNILLKISLEEGNFFPSKIVRTSYYKNRGEGIFGHILVARCVTESQQKEHFMHIY